ncbi:MAG: DUF1573 domain-containing protein [Chloroflexi bacterium]|uniref:DUF1573 domain-containing protein n=1 Tax=Candidatus Flexifilum breve TaxID=3140694 RepID=UPI0031357695|nr:DUF1573 domain-containing protein [Chloroflexota bacterium]
MSSQAKQIAARVQKTTTPHPPSRLPLILGLGAILVIGALLLSVLANQRPPYTPEVTGRAAVQVSQTNFDYGDQHYNNPVTTEFKVKNIGDQTLLILGDPQIEILEGCCPPRVSTSNRHLAPGDEATVSFTFSMHAGMDGPHHFRVHVRTNDPENPDQYVEVYSNWIP